MSTIRPVSHRARARRLPARVYVARWALVLASLTVLVLAVLAPCGTFTISAPAAHHACLVVGQSLSGIGVQCADGSLR